MPRMEMVSACGSSRFMRTYDIRANDLDAALGLVGNSECQGCAFKVSNGSATLETDMRIGGLYELDDEMISSSWRRHGGQNHLDRSRPSI